MNELKVIETNNQRVLTTAQIAEEYETDVKVISYNFNHNKERYIEGKHYYCLTGDDLKAFREFHELPSNINKFYLWTEKGALLHAKSLNTDKAWEAYEVLVDTYFEVYTKKQLPQVIEPNDKTKAIEAKLMNARVRMSNQFLKLAEVETSMSKDYKSILIAKAAEVLAGEEILALPKSEQKMYTATEIGEMFGISKQKVGSIANKNGLKTEEYGEFYKDKSPYCNKEVDSFRYNEKAVEKFRELLSL